MAEDNFRTVTVNRLGLGEYEAVNTRGERLRFGTGEVQKFTPVELLLVAIAGCSGADVDYITSKRAEPVEFSVTASGVKLRDAEHGNHMGDLEISFTVRFPEGPEGDAARESLPRAIERSHDRLCTVSRTVELGTPIRVVPGDEGLPTPAVGETSASA